MASHETGREWRVGTPDGGQGALPPLAGRKVNVCFPGVNGRSNRTLVPAPSRGGG